MAELRTRGVDVVEYDLPGLKAENGISAAGDALHVATTDRQRFSFAPARRSRRLLTLRLPAPAPRDVALAGGAHPVRLLGIGFDRAPSIYPRGMPKT